MPPVPEVWRPPLAVKLSAAAHGTALGTLALHPAWWPGLLAAVAANHLALGLGGMWPRSQVLGPVLHRLPQPGRRVALTFDDGPDPAVTPHVLDQLAAAGASASFFCIGERALRHKALVRRILAEGHGVENHSHTHPHHFAFLAGRWLRHEIMAAQSALADITGQAPRWFRAPMGLRSPLLDPILRPTGLRLASWTRRGYDTRCGAPDVVLARLTKGIAAGDVLLLHDGNAARSPACRPVVLEALPGLLATLHGCGLSAAALPSAMPDAADAAGSPAPGVYASR